MKKWMIAGIALVALVGCEQEKSAPPPPTSLGMANPASVYCIQQGGKLEMAKSQDGEVGYCLLPGGVRIEEWALFRRDHPARK